MLGSMRRLLLLLACVSLVGAGAALAARGDPQKEIVPADQARAKAMLLRKADLGPEFKATKTGSSDDDFYCEALDESDLTVTGEAESPDFEMLTVFVSSLSQVYASTADSSASWQRGTSAAGEKCVRDEFRRLFRVGSGRLVSFRRMAFPRVAEKSVAYRMVASSQGVRVFLDVIALKQGRAQAGVLFVSGLAPVPKVEETRLARIVEGRMKTAMRGA